MKVALDDSDGCDGRRWNHSDSRSPGLWSWVGSNAQLFRAGGVFSGLGGSFFSGGGLIDWSKNFLSTPWSQISCPRGAMPSSL